MVIQPLRHEKRDRLVDEPDRTGPAVTLVASVMQRRVPAAEDATPKAVCFDREPVPFQVLSHQERDLFIR